MPAPNIIFSAFRQNEMWVVWGFVLLFVYVAMRLLLLGAGHTVYFISSFLASILFFSFINAVYGSLPLYKSMPAVNNWKGWLMHGYGGKEKSFFGATSRVKKRCFYLMIVCFVLVDVGEMQGITKFSFVTIKDYITTYIFCTLIFLFFGLVVRQNFVNYTHWQKNEVYWVRCITIPFYISLLTVFFISMLHTASHIEKVLLFIFALYFLYLFVRLLHSLVANEKNI